MPKLEVRWPALLADTGGVEPLLLAALGPLEQAQHLLAFVQPGVKEGAGLGLAGGGAAMLQ